jgi:hypothetical protein
MVANIETRLLANIDTGLLANYVILMVANYGTGLLANYDIFPVSNFITYFHKYQIFSYNRSYGAENEEHDVKATFDYFEELKKEDLNFFYEFTLDNDGRVEHMFWVDGEARRLFALYGDCVSFDTTYCTNKYNMLCAPFIGKIYFATIHIA